MTAAVGILLIGVIDYASGAELRVFPLYFAPVSLVAWHHGRAGALLAAALCSISWLASNLLTGLSFSTPSLWVANTFVQGVSFATVGLLIASLRAALVREQDLGRTDPVTSVSNSRAFHEESGRLLALCRRKARPVTMAYIDLDHFKAVNDRLGHDARRRASPPCRRAPRLLSPPQRSLRTAWWRRVRTPASGIGARGGHRDAKPTLGCTQPKKPAGTASIWRSSHPPPNDTPPSPRRPNWGEHARAGRPIAPGAHDAPLPVRDGRSRGPGGLGADLGAVW